MALADSRSAFEQNCQEIDSSGDLFRAVGAQNMETFSQLAFVSGSSQQPMNQDDFSQLSAQVFENGAELGVAVKLRRLPLETAKRVNADLMRNSAEVSRLEARESPRSLGLANCRLPQSRGFAMNTISPEVTALPLKQCATGVHVCAKCHKEDHSLDNALWRSDGRMMWFHNFFIQAGLQPEAWRPQAEGAC